MISECAEHPSKVGKEKHIGCRISRQVLHESQVSGFAAEAARSQKLELGGVRMKIIRTRHKAIDGINERIGILKGRLK
jgi:hypothetical protein